VTELQPAELLALATARSLVSKRQAVGVNVASVLVAAIERLAGKQLAGQRFHDECTRGDACQNFYHVSVTLPPERTSQ